MISKKDIKDNSLHENYGYSSVASALVDIAELLVEWYSMQKGSVSDFLQKENLDKVMTPEQFQDVVLRKLYLPSNLLALIHKKQPFNLPLQHLSFLNTHVRQYYPSSMLKTDNTEVLRQLRQIKEEQKAERQKIKSAKRLENIEEEREKERKYSAAYRERHRQEINDRSREKYAQNKNDEEYLKKRRKISKKYRDTHKEEILQKNKERYYRNAEKYRKSAREHRKIVYKQDRFKNKTGPVILSLLEALKLKKMFSDKI